MNSKSVSISDHLASMPADAVGTGFLLGALTFALVAWAAAALARGR